MTKPSGSVTPVVLSGGSGTRLWPASRTALPKQLLPLNGDRTMLQDTVQRTDGVAATGSDPIIVCNEVHRFLVAEQLLEIGVNADVILEPEGRNTAPAIALAAEHMLAKEGGDALMLVMPADHVILDVGAFVAAVKEGVPHAVDGKLVTFGIVPTSAHTGYGYIQSAASMGSPAPVLRFVEKPDADRASEFIESGDYYWNAGIFLLGAQTFLEELQRFEPAMAEAVAASMQDAVRETDFLRPAGEQFSASPSKSIDYAVMEHTDRAMCVAMDAGWSDVGSWDSLLDVSDVDESGNALSGDVIALNTRSSLIRGQSRLVAAVGLDNMIIVEDKDTVLVAPRDACQDVKDVVAELERRGRSEAKLHRQVFRPWGSYDSIDSDDGFQVKHLIVNPGSVLSLQKHAHRAEHWVVVRGTARITLDDEVFDLGVNESTYIPVGAVHRIENPGDAPVHIVEVQCGDYLGEDDIVRLEDNYGREGTTT